MQVIYTNFDKLEISYQGAVPAITLLLFKEAKERAQHEETEQFITLGKIRCEVQPRGVQGGYAYSFSTGRTGANVFIKNDTNPQNWNIRIAIRSACLATKGLKGALEHIKDICNALGALGVRRNPNIKQTPFETLVESVARVDYCVDILANDFAPDPKRIIAHSRAQRKIYTPENMVIERGKELESFTIGKMPNKQICVYNKTREIAAKQTSYWYDIWSTVSYTIDAPTVTIGDNDTVWRFEVRVGRDALRDSGIVTLRHMQERLPALFDSMLGKYRLADNNAQGENPTRWRTHPLWEVFRQKASACFENEVVTMPSTVITDKERIERIEMMKKQFLGNFVSYTALLDRRLNEMEDVMLSISEQLSPYIVSDPTGLAQKFRQARERYADLR